MSVAQKRKGERLLIAMFIAFLALGFADVFFDLDSAPRQSKHQASLPTMPASIKQLAKFPGDLKLYCSFNSGLQDSLLLAHGSLKYYFLNTSPNNEVVVGKDGWLYMNRERSLDYFRNLYPLSKDEKAAWQSELERRRLHAESNGAAYLLTIAPNKHTVYPEYMPAQVQKRIRQSRLDELSELISNVEPSYPFLDLRPALFDAKKRNRIYHKTDTHWNSLGAAIAYREILQTLKNEFPMLADNLLAIDEPIGVPMEFGGDLARLVGLKFSLKEKDIVARRHNPRRSVVDENGEAIEFRVIDIRFQDRFETFCDQGEIDRATVFLDSFGVIMIPYLAQHFQHAEFYWQNNYDQELVETAKPSVVIQQVVERRLINAPAFEN